MWLGVIFAYTALGVLAVLVIDVFLDALPRLNIRFLTSLPFKDSGKFWDIARIGRFHMGGFPNRPNLLPLRCSDGGIYGGVRKEEHFYRDP